MNNTDTPTIWAYCEECEKLYIGIQGEGIVHDCRGCKREASSRFASSVADLRNVKAMLEPRAGTKSA